MNMDSIINEIIGLDKYVELMKNNGLHTLRLVDLDNLLMHIGNLKKWAGIDLSPQDYEKLIMGNFNPRFTPNDKIIMKMSLDIRENFMSSNPLQKSEETAKRLEEYLTEALNSISSLNTN